MKSSVWEGYKTMFMNKKGVVLLVQAQSLSCDTMLNYFDSAAVQV